MDRATHGPAASTPANELTPLDLLERQLVANAGYANAALLTLRTLRALAQDNAAALAPSAPAPAAAPPAPPAPKRRPTFGTPDES